MTKNRNDQHNKAQLEHSDVWLTNVHSPSLCEGRACTIHHRTDHPLRSWMQHFRLDSGVMERIDPKSGIGHPDPDCHFEPGAWQWIHGCDGACAGAYRDEIIEHISDPYVIDGLHESATISVMSSRDSFPVLAALEIGERAGAKDLRAEVSRALDEIQELRQTVTDLWKDIPLS